MCKLLIRVKTLNPAAVCVSSDVDQTSICYASVCCKCVFKLSQMQYWNEEIKQ